MLYIYPCTPSTNPTVPAIAAMDTNPEDVPIVNRAVPTPAGVMEYTVLPTHIYPISSTFKHPRTGVLIPESANTVQPSVLYKYIGGTSFRACLFGRPTTGYKFTVRSS